MLINHKECSNCKATTNKTAIRLMADGEQWWHFSNYKTKAGNVYSGLFCPDCSDSVYIENKQVTAEEAKAYIEQRNKEECFGYSYDELIGRQYK